MLFVLCWLYKDVEFLTATSQNDVVAIHCLSFNMINNCNDAGYQVITWKEHNPKTATLSGFPYGIESNAARI